MNPRKKAILLITIALLIILAIYFLQENVYRFEIEEIKSFVNSFGLLGPLVLIILITLSIVVSPLTSIPFWLVGLALFGFWSTCFYVLVSHTIGSVVNFLVAQRWGRPIVAKLVGKKTMEKIDEVTKIIGLKMLFIARLLGGASADYVSYAAGLTSMKFKPYLLISVLAAIPMICLNLYLLDKVLAIKPIFLAFLAPFGWLLALVFPLVVYKWPKKKPGKIT